MSLSIDWTVARRFTIRSVMSSRSLFSAMLASLARSFGEDAGSSIFLQPRPAARQREKSRGKAFSSSLAKWGDASFS